MAASEQQSLDLEGSIVVLLTMLANQLSATGSATFQKRHGLSSAEWKIMAIVASVPGSSGADITQVLSIDKAAISRTVRAMADRGLLLVERTPSHGNHKAIVLSAAGQELHRQALATALEREQCLLADIPQAERAQLHDQLRLLVRRMPILAKLADLPIGASGMREALLADVAAELPVPRKIASSGEQSALLDRVDRLESLLADLMLENASLRQGQTPAKA